MSEFLPVHVILNSNKKVSKTSLSERDIKRVFRNAFCYINSPRYAELGNKFDEVYRKEYAYGYNR